MVPPVGSGPLLIEPNLSFHKYRRIYITLVYAMVHLFWSQMRESWSVLGEIPDIKKNREVVVGYVPGFVCCQEICTWVYMSPRENGVIY